MSIWGRLKDAIGFQLPPSEMSAQQENQIIEKIAGTISKYGMEYIAILMGSMYVPVATIVTQTTLLPMAPLLEAVGIPGFRYTAFFEKKENVKKLLERIEQLLREREAKGSYF
jgi:hypothetical protein